MEWSNLNEQMIEQFFQNSNSPSNAQISLNFTRTSRQMGSNQKPNKDISPRLQIQTNPQHQKPINPQNDILAFAEKQISKFDSWITAFNNEQQRQNNQFDFQWEAIQRDILKHQHQARPPKQSSLQSTVLSKMEEVSKKVSSLSYPKPCQHCALSERKIFELQNHLNQLEMQLQAKTLELTRNTEKQIKEIGSELSFQVENRLLTAKVEELTNKNVQLSESIQAKNFQLNKLGEEINKLHFEKSNFLSKTKALQTRAQQLEKSKSFLMSAAKNSTSHSDFNITNQALLNKSQNQPNIDTTLIHTNQFSTDKPTVDDYLGWFERLKQVYMEKYRKEEKEHLKKFPELKNNPERLKLEINNFKKGSTRYEMARSWMNIVNYVSKNKENFLGLLWNEVGGGIKIPLFEGTGVNEKENMKGVEYWEEELKKAQKKAQGLLSEIQNLNQQLMNMKKTLLKEKQENTKLSRLVDQLNDEITDLKQELQTNPQNFNHIDQIDHLTLQHVHQLEERLIQVQQELLIKSQQLQKISLDFKTQEQAQIRLSQSVKDTQRLLHKQRLEKLTYFKQCLPSQPLTTACRIRAKSINQKKFPSILHEIESRIYLEKDKLSYRFDMCEQTGKKSTQEIYSLSKKILINSIYEPSRSFIFSMGSTDSEYSEYMRGENGLVLSLMSEVYKVKLSEKKFIQVDVWLSVIEMGESRMIDLMDGERNKKVWMRREGSQVVIENCLRVPFESDQQAMNVLSEAYSRQNEMESHMITIVEFSITDKRSKIKFNSRIFLGEMGIENPNQETKKESLGEDARAFWKLLKGNNSKDQLSNQENRLTCLLSECMSEKGKNLVIMSVSPTEMHRQQSVYSLNWASSLKYVSTEKPQSLIRYSEKTPEQSVSGSRLRQNSSHSLMQTPTLKGQLQEKGRSITKHRNSSSQHSIFYGGQNNNNGEKRKRTISRMSIC